MGKVLKYCGSCDEGFAERFTFCPDCAGPLQAVELNPIAGRAADEPAPAETAEFAAPTEEFVSPEPEIAAYEAAPAEPEVIEEVEEVVEEEPVYGAEPAPTQPFYQTAPMYADEPRAAHSDSAPAVDEPFHVTIVEEKNGKQRNGLLLGATALMLVLSVGAWGVSLFQKTLDIGAIGEEQFLASLIDDVPMTVEEEKEQEKEKDDGGGGGGGGREEENETSQGDLANQTREKILIRPDANIVKADFELKQPPAMTEGDRKFPKNFDRYGDPNSKFLGISNGTGFGGGQGSGFGQGQGSGRGTGVGSGTGSGSGSGNGDGNGDGDGSGGNNIGAPPPPKPVGVTTNYKILAKPKAQYTDAARTNNIQGSVKLRVVLLASGAVGSITPVTRLPHGLTEQAIAAARQIRFEPKKINGVPQAVTVTIDYGFNIY